MTITTSDGVTQNEVFEPTGDEAVDGVLKKWMPAEDNEDAVKPSPKEKKEPDASTKDAKTEDTSEETPDGDEDADAKADGEDEDKPAAKKYAEGDTYVKFTVDGKEQEFAVKDLTRLAGQEASLTRKSQEVAAQRKTVDEQGAKYLVGLNAVLEKAKERAKPYLDLDFLVVAQQVSPEDLAVLRKDAQRAFEEVNFYEKELDGFMGEVAKRQQDEQVTSAREAIKVLTGPVDKGGIEGWNDKVYDDTRAFAIKEGLNAGLVNGLTDPAAIKLLHMAMQFAKSKTAVVTTKVNKVATKVVKSSASAAATNAFVKGAVAGKEMKTLKKSGRSDDAVAALEARWAAAAENQD